MLTWRDFSSTSPQVPVAGLVADEAGPRVAAQRQPALLLEARRVWIDAAAAADALGGVAGRAVALAVASDARIQVSHGLPGVVHGAARRRRPLVGRGMEAPAGHPRAARRVSRDARAAVAVGAERLLLVTARAARVVLPRGLRVHGEPVVRVHLSRADA